MLAILIASMLAAGSPEPAVVRGVGISPRGFPNDYSQLAAFYTEVAGIPGGGVLWNGAWRGDVAGGTDSGSIPPAARAVVESSSAFGFVPIVVFGWRSETTLHLNVPGNAVNNWTNASAKALFISMLSNFAASYRPPFVFLGNENDFYYEQNPADYANWIAFYNAAYDAIKASSPSTLVGPVFNYEHLSGAGALNGWTASHWPALETHDLTRVDVVGVTVYPWLNFARAESVPANYLDPLMARIGAKPIAITETGWPAENLGGLNPPWETSEPAQVTYLARLAAMLRGKPVTMVNHLFLHAMQNPGGNATGWKIFGSISLRDAAGNARPAYAEWLRFRTRPSARGRAARH